MRFPFRRGARAPAVAAALALAAATGCAPLGNLLLPPHPASLRRDEPRLTLSDRADCAPGPARPQSAAAVAGGVVIAAAQAFLAREAERYQASASATGSSDDLLEDRCIRFEGGGADLELRLAPAFEGPAEARRPRNATRVEAGVFRATGARSKVASWPPRTWVRTGRFPWPESTSGRIGSLLGFANPVMVLHFLWGLLDDDAYQVEYAARLRIEAIGDNRRIAATSLTLPLGRHPLDAMRRGRAEDGPAGAPLRHGLESGYFPLPKGDPLLANVTVSVIESNDLGDLVGRGAELVGERRATILELLGLQ